MALIYSLDWFCWENLNRKPMGFYHQIVGAFRLKFSHHPILWVLNPVEPRGEILAFRRPEEVVVTVGPGMQSRPHFSTLFQPCWQRINTMKESDWKQWLNDHDWSVFIQWIWFLHIFTNHSPSYCIISAESWMSYNWTASKILRRTVNRRSSRPWHVDAYPWN